MQGSLRRLDQKLRVNVAWIDTTTAAISAADRYDTGYEELFSLEDDIVNSIASKLALKVTASQQASIDERETTSIAAYDAYRRGWANALRKTPGRAGRGPETVQAGGDHRSGLCPRAGGARARLLECLDLGLGVQRRRDVGNGPDAGRRSMRSWRCAGRRRPPTNSPRRSTSMPASTTRRGVSPSWPSTWTRRTQQPGGAGGGEDLLRRAGAELGTVYRRDAPRSTLPALHEFVHGFAEFGLERYDSAAELLQRALARNPEDFSPAAPLAALYVHLARRTRPRKRWLSLPRRLAGGQHRGVRHLLALPSARSISTASLARCARSGCQRHCPEP